LKRDLGTVTGSDGRPRRQCLVRQAEREPVGGRCEALPYRTGWYYVPAAESEEECPTAVFVGPGGAELFETGSRVVLRCR
jgi:hypothetical protein